MNTMKICTAFCAALLAPAAVGAAELTGSSLQLSYSAFTDDTSVSRFGIEGSAEIAFTRQISLQLDLGHQSFGESDVNGNALGLHAIYHLDQATSLGAFYTRENVEDADLDLYGVEAGYEIGRWEFEGLLGRTESDQEDASIVGAFARYEMANDVGVTGSFDRVDVGGVDLTRLGLKLDREVAPGFTLFVEVGTADIDDGTSSASETFVGLGGKIAFGAERGATFEQRGFLRLIPGL